MAAQHHEHGELLKVLKERFYRHSERHPAIQWEDVAHRLEQNQLKLESLYRMEQSGGEPDVLWQDDASGAYVFVDCSAESPKGRRSLCYDRLALESRKEHAPLDSAVGMAQTMGIELLDEKSYRLLQQVGEFDLKTSSWILTPQSIRNLGGALFCDRRYNTVFTYHNGADSYYAVRGFRGMLTI